MHHEISSHYHQYFKFAFDIHSCNSEARNVVCYRVLWMPIYVPTGICWEHSDTPRVVFIFWHLQYESVILDMPLATAWVYPNILGLISSKGTATKGVFSRGLSAPNIFERGIFPLWLRLPIINCFTPPPNVWSEFNIWNAKSARATTHEWMFVLKFLRQKIFPHEGDSKPQSFGFMPNALTIWAIRARHLLSHVFLYFTHISYTCIYITYICIYIYCIM